MRTKTVWKILRVTLLYALFLIIENYVFSFLIYKFRISHDISFYDILLMRLLDESTSKIHTTLSVIVIILLQRFLEVVAISILASYIFTYILNRRPTIVFPDKLVIRHRTSEGSNKLLTLGILIGNKSKFNLHNVECVLTCYYVKTTKPLLTNGEFSVKYMQPIVSNYFRFSFVLREFPSKILEDFIYKDPECYELDSIGVLISGNSNFLGNAFRVTKRYKLSDIVFDEHIPDFTDTIKNPLTGKVIIKKINWDEISKVVEVNETTRQEIVEEIKEIIDEKHNKKCSEKNDKNKFSIKRYVKNTLQRLSDKSDVK